MKQITVVTAAVLALWGSATAARADTKLLWRTPTAGVTIAPNTQAKLIELNKIDVSAYDRIRVVVIARRPAGLALNLGFGAPFHIELHMGEGTDDLGLLENGLLALNPTSTAADVAAHTERGVAVFDEPVITTLLVEAVGPTSGSILTTADIYVYGQTSPLTAAP